jgi:hypothetical protein
LFETISVNVFEDIGWVLKNSIKESDELKRKKITDRIPTVLLLKMYTDKRYTENIKSEKEVALRIFNA